MGKLSVILPIVPGNGGKYLTTSLANAYISTKGGKVAIADFDVKNPYLAHALIEDRVHGVDNLIDKIDSNLLDETLFTENMVKLKNGVELLKGTKLIGRHKIFNKKHAETILKFLRNSYTQTFVSITPDTDNAFTVCAIFEADEIVLVSRNNISTIHSFDRVINIVNNYKKTEEPIKLIHNMYLQGSKNDVSQLITRYGISVLGAIEYDEATIDNINILGSGLKIFKNKNKNEEQLKTIIDYMQ